MKNSEVKIEIEHDFANTYKWSVQTEENEYSGTIKLPKDERGLVDIEWDNSDLPECWENIEEKINGELCNFLYSKFKQKGERT